MTLAGELEHQLWNAKTAAGLEEKVNEYSEALVLYLQ